MSHKSDLARLYRVLELIQDAEDIINNHGSIEAALRGKVGEYALMMIITQIGERLGKLESAEFTSRLPVRESSALRNVIVHDYEGINTNRIRLVFERSLPELKQSIQALIPPLDP
jgi:uncharacterized protein with HEPN domain